jgi:hypothetical protein
MTTAEAREQIGQFGKIHANGDNYPKEIYGRITDVDRSSLEFTDNNDFLYIFKVAKVISFEPMTFVDNNN